MFYLKGSEFVPRDSLKAIAYLEPCVEAAYSDAQLLMGRLYLNSTNPDNYKKGFSLLKKAAKQDNEKAACDLGILYKYGKGCQMNFDKSRKWFQTAAELGSSKAAYSLGYLSYKGLGTIEQDYTEAVQWFQKSDYPHGNTLVGTKLLFWVWNATRPIDGLAIVRKKQNKE